MTELPLSEKLEALIAGYVLDSLEPDEMQEFEQILATNPSLTTEIKRFQETLSQLAYVSPVTSPPAHLRSAILNDRGMDFKPVPKRSPLVWLTIVAGLPTLIAFSFGFDSYRLRQELVGLRSQISYQKDTIAMLQQPTTSLVSLKGMDMAPTASGNVVITPGEQQAVLALQNLPMLPSGQTYYLWAVIDGKKVACGQFHPSSQGKVLAKLAIPQSSQIQSLVVTLEASTLPIQPSKKMVMTSGA